MKQKAEMTQQQASPNASTRAFIPLPDSALVGHSDQWSKTGKSHNVVMTAGHRRSAIYHEEENTRPAAAILGDSNMNL